MADAIVSLVAERAATILEEQIRREINLVRGVEKQLQSLSDELKTIRNVLDDAERKGYKDKSVKDWLRRLEHTSYEMDDLLDEWDVANINLEMEQYSIANVARSKNKVRSCIPSSSCLCFKKVGIRRDIGKKLENVKSKLDLILAEKDRYGFLTSHPTDHSRESWRVQSSSLIDLGEVRGRNSERENLVSKLVFESRSTEELGIRVLSILGVGGIGKTTLAQLAYNDSRVQKYFELRIWICVSDPFDEVGIAKEIIQRAGRSPPNTNQFDMLLQCLKEAISGKKFLLVMDDVWSEDNTKWEPLKIALKCGGADSKVLVTTRNTRVATMMGTVEKNLHYLEHLSDKDCWLLLSRIALSGKNKEECEKFHHIGKNIANKCKGLPLAAKTLGSLLRFKRTLEEWENVLNSEIWELEKVEVDLFPHLLLSYNELSPQLKRCFSYCAVFPKDTRIDVDKLITKWMALGYLGFNTSTNNWELRGREYVDNLAMRSLFEAFKRGGDSGEQIESFKMHDIVHDFAQYLRKDIGQVGTKETSTSSPLLVSHAKEFRSLFCYKQPLPPDVYDFVKNLRLLSLRKCGLRSVPKKMEKLIHLRWLDLGMNEFGAEDLKTIFRLYKLQFLWLNNCSLREIPQEIGNLVHLIHLDLSRNMYLKELPENLCNLSELESLNVSNCIELSILPQGIHRLIKLKHLSNSETDSLKQYPQGLAQLTSLRTLCWFRGGTRWSKLGWLKNLNRLTADLALKVELNEKNTTAEPLVEDAREAELRNKTHIRKLEISFLGYEIRDSVWRDLIEALEPHQDLQNLKIQFYGGTQFAGWIASPLNRLRSIELVNCENMSLMPPLGKLPFLEEIYMSGIDGLQFMGREFLGVDSSSSSSSSGSIMNTTKVVIGFPKLKKLRFKEFKRWTEWEDITAEEEDSHFVSFMPCLEHLIIAGCPELKKLPHRLLRNASSLERLDITHSSQLVEVYGYKLGEAWKSISRYSPRIELINNVLW